MTIEAARLGTPSIRIPLRERGLQLWRIALETAAISAAALSDMPFLDHLEELRSRILKSLAAVAVGLVICFSYTVPLIDFALRPIQGIPGITLISIDTTEIFGVYFKMALVGAICLAAPVILWQVWKFIAPGLYKHERRYAGPFIISTTVSFIGGAVFAYKALLPVSLTLSTTLAQPIRVEQHLTVSNYLDTLSWMVLTMGIVFELPPVVFILSRIGLVSAGLLARNFSYAVLVATIAGALLTPSTDIPTMLLVSVPIVALYVMSMLVALIFGKKRQTDA